MSVSTKNERLVCQLPGCKTTHKDVQSALEEYLEGYCTVIVTGVYISDKLFPTTFLGCLPEAETIVEDFFISLNWGIEMNV